MHETARGPWRTDLLFARVGWGPLTPLRVTDGYADAAGSTEGRLLGRVTLFHAEDFNTARSAATRAAIESAVFAPPSVLPGRGVTWRAETDNVILARFDLRPEVSTFRTHKTRPGRAPSIARGPVVLIQTGHDHRPAPGASQRRVPAPRHHFHHCAAPLDEPSTRVQAIRPSDLPLTVTDRWITDPLGFPWTSHPAITRNARQGGDGPLEHGSEISVYGISRTSNLADLLDACDLASHS